MVLYEALLLESGAFLFLRIFLSKWDGKIERMEVSLDHIRGGRADIITAAEGGSL